LNPACQNSCAWIHCWLVPVHGSRLVVDARTGKIAGDGLTFAGRRRWVPFSVQHSIYLRG
jgi:hypothetical protein